MEAKRRAGVLLHITSLPSKYGIGTLGKEAYEFVNWLEKANMHVWQVLPLVPTNYGDSPYQSVSSTALNYYLLDFDILKDKGLLQLKDYEKIQFQYIDQRVDYYLLFQNKVEVLKKAFENFDKNEQSFVDFIQEGKYHDFAIFMTIKALHQYQSWIYWKEPYKEYSLELEKRIVKDYAFDYLFWQWTQYEFLDEWNNLHQYAKKHHIEIMGDMPLYVAYDSVEVWKYPQLFVLKEHKELKQVAGCPPDAFSETGQLWGNPIYNWSYMKDTNYTWWNQRIAHAFSLFDLVRIDHFRGFDRYYAIPAKDSDAKNGKWEDGPKFDFFKDKLHLNIVAEDLGMIDEGVRKLMKETNYPGMKVLSFAFDGQIDNEHKPSNYTENYIVYTGTHDNMPLLQMISEFNEQQYETFYHDLEKECLHANIELKDNLVETIVELAFFSKAKLCIVPMQDLLNQGKSSRMNFPSTVSTDNWSYRIAKQDLSDSLACRLSNYCKKYGR